MTPELVVLERSAFAALQDDVLDVYAEAMDVRPEAARTRRTILAAHLERDGLAAVGALDHAGTLLGVAYGYRGARGQWWHDQVRAALTRDARRTWLADCFELVELHVRPDAQGGGIGSRQLAALLARPVHATVLLSTPEADEQRSRAWRLYRRFGFVDVLRHFHFPGDARPFAVLGRPLPR